MNIKKLIAGPGYTIYELVEKNICLLTKFIEELSKNDKTQVAAIIRLISEKGDPYNTQKLRHIGNQVYEIKTRGGIRILCFKANNPLFEHPRFKSALILVKGFRKPKERVLMREKEKVLKYMKEFSEGHVNVV